MLRNRKNSIILVLFVFASLISLALVYAVVELIKYDPVQDGPAEKELNSTARVVVEAPNTVPKPAGHD
jgi:hypothetical protein